MMSNRANEYPLLSKDDAVAVKELLEQTHEHFYHYTLVDYIVSIKETGLDPSFEGTDSGYQNRRREPPNAIRYCTRGACAFGLSAALTRNQIYRDYSWHPHSRERIILLRTKASSLLSRPFGLDHSHSDASSTAEAMIHGNKDYLTPNEFIKIVTDHGGISCYEAIPANELEICGDELRGKFFPLLE